jgi:hypothetical protein
MWEMHPPKATMTSDGVLAQTAMLGSGDENGDNRIKGLDSQDCVLKKCLASGRCARPCSDAVLIAGHDAVDIVLIY